MLTGTHTCIHLRDKKIWSTLHADPVHHTKLLSRCDHHLVYLGFGIFLHLNHHSPIEPSVNIIGTVHSDNPALLIQLVQTQGCFTGTTKPTSTSMTTMTARASAAASSAAQLPRVEAELHGSQPKPVVKPVTNPIKAEPMPAATSSPAVQPKVNLLLFNVKLVRLTPTQIKKYTNPANTSKPTGQPEVKGTQQQVKPVSICLY